LKGKVVTSALFIFLSIMINVFVLGDDVKI